jgi:hypothetical protein
MGISPAWRSCGEKWSSVACEKPLNVIGVAIGRNDWPATVINIEFGDIPETRALS